jgi:hypothetical protein
MSVARVPYEVGYIYNTDTEQPGIGNHARRIGDVDTLCGVALDYGKRGWRAVHPAAQGARFITCPQCRRLVAAEFEHADPTA